MSIPLEIQSGNNAVLKDSRNSKRAILNNVEYEFDVFIYNTTTIVQVADFEELLITDNIYSIFTYGHLVINNTNLIGYRFNTPSRDMLYVRIRPIPNSQKKNTLSDKIFTLEYLFEIYDQDEISNPEKFQKFKILKFRDVREQLMDEINWSWNTGEVLKESLGYNINTSQLSDSDRSVKTGDALKYILDKSLKTFSPQFADDWDSGATTYFYSSPANFTLMDDIEKILDLHVSGSTGDKCILKFNRGNTFELRSFADHFKRSVNKQQKLPGDFTIDIFPIASVVGPYSYEQDTQEGRIPKRAKPERYSYDLAFEIDKFIDMINYGYCDLASEDGKHICSRAVHTYYPTTGVFNIDMKDTGSDELYSTSQRLYADTMGAGKSYILFPSSKRKDVNLILNNVAGLDNDAFRLARGRADQLRDLVYMNNSINFYCDGHTARRTGRFATITTQVTLQDTDFEKVINGEWFITRVDHLFTGKNYTNDITAVKTYSYDKLS